MSNKAYKFYESDTTLQQILDELVHDRQLSQTIHNLLLNGLGKDIKKTKKQLKHRIESLDRVGKMYTRLQTNLVEKKEGAYQKYKNYREGLIKNDMAYEHSLGLEWISKKAEGLHTKAEDLLKEFEDRYGSE